MIGVGCVRRIVCGRVFERKNGLQEKFELRKILNGRFLELCDAYMHSADAAIAANLLASEAYAAADTIFSYVGVKREIRTLPLITRALSDGKRLCAPSIRGNGVMDARVIASIGDLSAEYQGLTEPAKHCAVMNPREIDLIIVPCLSCDPYGNRIGYGGGYYDRYLKQVRPDACKIVVCRKQLLSDVLPFGPNDIRADLYVTEDGLFPVAVRL
ncbi:MAG: 5-formyltetrahydrofolate cyclo-ligase [Clostridiales Family XIII bacterium]|nr:5-formyltetrahydrofolate cyclo-ligase [Clostridiales Family XIII bacterium]